MLMVIKLKIEYFICDLAIDIFEIFDNTWQIFCNLHCCKNN